MHATHIIAGAHSRARLVLDDLDRMDLLERLREGLGVFLAYCVMDTHLHVVVEKPPATVRPLAETVLLAYTRAFNRRHGFRGTLLRARPEPFEKLNSRELARAISYVHENPLEPRRLAREVDFEWSSARAFAGLARDRFVDIGRARSLLGAEVRWIALESPALLELVPLETPLAAPETILGAAAAVFRVHVDDLVSSGRSSELRAARSVYVTVGRFESYSDR
jgi:hypothetical protein